MNSKIVYPFLFLLISSTLPCMLLLQTTNAQVTEIVVEPEKVYAAPQTRFTIYIRVKNVYKLFAFQFNLTWSPDVVEIENKSMIVEGDFLKRGGAYLTFPAVVLNKTVGFAFIGNTLSKPAVAASGSGDLYSITFLMKAKGGSLLTLTNTKLKDDFNAAIDHTVENGLATSCKVSLKPSETIKKEPSLGETINLNATVENPQNLTGFQLTVQYNTTIFNVTSADFGSLLQSNSNFTVIDRDQGTITLNLTSSAEPVNENGTLATFSFKILTVGTTWVTITNSTLMAIGDQAIIHVVQDAYFSNKYINLGIVSIEMSATEVTQGENVTITVTVKNNGTLTESFDVAIYVNQSLIAQPSVTNLDPDQQKEVEALYETTDLEGEYTLIIKAEIPVLSGETETTDNIVETTKLLTVNPKGIPIPIEAIVAIIIIIIVVALVLIVYMRRRKK